jgi:3'-phosphoadenosine 5'-phosphosulfate sulfotransferase (PAPS reductase)/FAD synthetase
MTFQPDLLSYDRILVAFSGGKDSLACVLHLLELGVPADRIELHHHDVDGHGATFMDWSVTPAYCRAVAAELGLPIFFSYKLDGFQREMDRDGTATAPVRFEIPGGEFVTVGGKGPAGTRGKFPQVSPDLSVRWCSAYLKIDVMDVLIRNQDRFLNSRTLVVTGERAEESPSRARYQTFEPHRTDTRNGSRKVRTVDHWRPIHSWVEADVWAIIRRAGIVPHVAYSLGWGRLSCMTCIFGSADQWATIRAVFPSRFEAIRDRETASGSTIQRKADVAALADRGRPYPAALAHPELVQLAQGDVWSIAVRVAPEAWTMPAGAFGESAGPV